ncbi:hypothetical protein [Ensifer sp. ENS01]|nr:hypothetical protein [Ensifer sp. ENS01]
MTFGLVGNVAERGFALQQCFPKSLDRDRKTDLFPHQNATTLCHLAPDA